MRASRCTVLPLPYDETDQTSPFIRALQEQNMNEIVRPPSSDPNTGWNASPTHSVSIARESQDTGQIAAALVAALSKLRNPPRNRSVEVSTRGGGKYGFRYATLDKILDMARPVLAEEGLVLFQPISTNEKGGLVLVTRLLHRSGEWMETSIPLPAPGGDPQAFGSAVTYLRRYAVTALLGIASDEDDDANRAAGNHLRDLTPRHERLRDEAGRTIDPVQALTIRAKGARDVDDGTDLLRAWANAAAATEALRGRPEWETLVRHVGVGLRNSLGQMCASAFVRAARMAGPEDVAAFEAAWGGEWAHTLMMMQEEAPETYRVLQGHVVSQIRRARRGGAAESAVQGEAGGTGAAPDDGTAKPAAAASRSAVAEGGPRRAARGAAAGSGAERRRSEPVA
jgi:ERF superfamily